jgi:hypothetical protein
MKLLQTTKIGHYQVIAKIGEGESRIPLFTIADTDYRLRLCQEQARPKCRSNLMPMSFQLIGLTTADI